MSKNEHSAAKLEISYKQFLAVLKKWDAYVWPEIKYTPRDFSTLNSSDAEQHGVLLGVDVPSSIKLSELASILWKSLEAGASEVDRIHDEFYVDYQVEHFKETYQSPEEIADNIHGLWRSLEHPTEMLLKLGKPAQIVLVQEGQLLKAVSNYQQAESIIYEKEYAEQETEERKRREARERRSDPNYVRLILGTTRKIVRDLDKHQCVFCSADAGTRPGNTSYVRLTPKAYKVNEVVLACKSCKVRLQGRTPEQVGMTPLHGRFSESMYALKDK